MSLQSIYNIRYAIPQLQQRTESAVIKDVENVNNEDSSTPDHASRVAWAQWAHLNTNLATTYFMWPLAMNPSVQNSVDADPTGSTVTDNDIQFVVDAALPRVIADCAAHPPTGYNPATP